MALPGYVYDGRAPRYEEERNALAELIHAASVQPFDVLEVIAADRLTRANLPLDHPSPDMVARGNGFDLCPCDRNAYCGGILYYRDRRERRRRGWSLWHELAEGILARSGLPHFHADVQVLAVMLAVERSYAERIVRRMGRAAGIAWLCRAHRDVPAWAVRVRLELAQRVAQAA